MSSKLEKQSPSGLVQYVSAVHLLAVSPGCLSKRFCVRNKQVRIMEVCHVIGNEIRDAISHALQ